jgi:hypothetical protein
MKADRRQRTASALLLQLALMLLVGPFVSSMPLRAQDRAPLRAASGDAADKRGARQLTKSGTADAQRLIDAIANHNPRPRCVGEDPDIIAVFDKKYDWSEQHRVEKAIQTLLDRAEEAWPELLKHLDDARYCITLDVNGSAINVNVCGACRNLMVHTLSSAHIDHIPHESFIAFSNLRIPDFAGGDNAKLIAWCRERSNKKLYELQIETCQWAVKAVADLELIEDEISEADKARSIAEITARIETLRRTKKAVKCERLFWGDSTYYTPHRAKHDREQYDFKMKRTKSTRSHQKKPVP